MKKHIASLLAIILCISLLGCEQESHLEKPLNFYYPRATLSFESNSTSILPEAREGAQMGDLSQILSVYLAGPESENLKSPFPKNVRLVQARQEDNTVFVTVTNELATLSGLELVIACGCITMTCLELTGAEYVSISAEGQLLNGQKAVIMDKNSILLLDESRPSDGE